MTTVTTGKLHCKQCGKDKAPTEMRKDSSYASGYRPQCRACKQLKEKGKKRPVTAKPKVKKKKKLTPEERVYPCNVCKRDDVPFEEMTKDKRRFMGVGVRCLPCRRERDRELFAQSQAKREKKAQAEKERRAQKSRYLDSEYEHCWKCNAKYRSEALRQPPAAVASGFPDGAKICSKCVGRVGGRADVIQAERRRLGIPEGASRQQMESAARVAALRELAKGHETEYRALFRRYLDAIGVEQEKKWISL